MTDPLIKIKKQLESYLETPLANSPQLLEMLMLLQKHNYLPNKVSVGIPNEGSGEYDPNTRKMMFSGNVGNRENLVTHEMSHAVSDMMDKAWIGLDIKLKKGYVPSPDEQRFYEGYLKLMPTKSKVPNDASTYKKKEDAIYRFGDQEAQAFGIGNMYGSPVNPTLPHYDTTMATEFNLLSDLFDRSGLNPYIK